jgi:hypothetical protein
MDYTYENIQYPDLYYRLNPKIDECVNRYMNDNPAYTMPTEEELNQMVDDVYDQMIKECPEIDQDPADKRRVSPRNSSIQQRPFYSRRRLLRDITAILLLQRLFGGRRYPGYGYPGYGYPGYGYPGYGYPGYGYPGYGYGPFGY